MSSENTKDNRDLQCFILSIPNDVKTLIFKYLGPDDLCTISRTCKRLKEISERDDIWKLLGNPKWESYAIKFGWKKMYLDFLRTQIGSHFEGLKNNENVTNTNSETKEIEKGKKITQGCVKYDYAPKEEMSHDYLFKLLVVGDTRVGKSCMVLRLADDSYMDSYVPTLGVLISYEVTAKIQIWDTSGAERMLSSSFFKGAHGVLIVYDITNRTSFQNIPVWLAQTEKYTSSIPNFGLIGAKKDLEANREVTTHEAQQYLSTLNHRITVFMESSAKTKENIKEVFAAFAVDVVSRISSSPASYLGGYYKLGWPNYVPSSETIQKMVFNQRK